MAPSILNRASKLSLYIETLDLPTPKTLLSSCGWGWCGNDT
jgi:hypothetical protein